MPQDIHWTDWPNPQTSTGRTSMVLKNGDITALALTENTLDTSHPVDLTKAEVIDPSSAHHNAMPIRELAHSRNQSTLSREKGTLP